MRALISLFALAGLAFPPVLRADDKPTIGPPDLKVEGEAVRAILPPDAIPSIDAPELLSRDQADRVYSDEEPILGVVIAGEAHAYSLWHLDAHEIVNDELGGAAIAATW